MGGCGKGGWRVDGCGGGEVEGGGKVEGGWLWRREDRGWMAVVEGR